MGALYGHFAECFGLCTRQSDQIFFIVPVVSIFRYKHNKYISEYMQLLQAHYKQLL